MVLHNGRVQFKLKANEMYVAMLTSADEGRRLILDHTPVEISGGVS
jgi:hypothetical protein